MDCACEKCQNFCRHKPGWFTPDQIAPLVRRLNVTVEALFRTYLTIDAVLVEENGQPKGIYVLAPALVGQRAGAIADPTAKGACVWFKDGQCAIHDMKPLECQRVDHATTPQDGNLLRASILKAWMPRKSFVQDLYGSKLKPPEALKAAYRAAKRRRVGGPVTDSAPIPAPSRDMR